MKILAIRGKNLASLEGEFEIDFTSEPLKSAGIFAITGNTGSGKSTLLDAVCLALFDDTPRTSSAAENSVQIADVKDRTVNVKDSRNILRRGTADGYAEVDFVSLGGEKFRSRWSVRRARDKADGSLQSSELRLTNITTGSEVQGRKTELLQQIIAITGLTFDQFTRTVLLAQGDFATFLKATQKEKAELLEKLTGTEVYSRISIAVYEKAKVAEMQLNAVRERMNDIELLSDDTQCLLIAERQTVTAETESQRKEIEQLSDKIKWITDEQTLAEGVHHASQHLDAATAAVEGAANRYSYLAQVDSVQEIRDCFNELKNTSRQLVENRNRLESQQTVHDSNKQLLNSATAKTAACNQALAKHIERFENVQPKIKQARELDVELERAKANAALSQKEYKQAEEKKLQLEKNIAEKHILIDLATKTASQATLWLGKNEHYRTVVPRIDLISALIDDATAATQQQALGSKTLATLQERLAGENIRHSALVNEAERLNRLLPAEIAALRAKLQSGMPCPVCGSEHHPYQNIAGESLEEAKLNRAKKEISAQIALHSIETEKMKNESIRLSSIIENYSTQAIEAINRLDGMLAAIPNWKPAFEKQTLQPVLKQAAQAWNQNEAALNRAVEQRTNHLAALELATRELNSIIDIYTAKADKYKNENAIVERLNTVRTQLFAGKTADEAETLYINRQKELLEAVNRQKEAENSIVATVEKQAGIISQLLHDVSMLDEQSQLLTGRVNSWLASKNSSLTVESLTRLLARDNAWIINEREQLNSLHQNRTSALATLDERRKTLENHHRNTNKPAYGETKEMLLQTVHETQLAVQHKTARNAEIDLLLAAHSKGKERMAMFEKELNEKQQLCDSWKKLNDLLGSADGAKFKVLAQGYTLDALLACANIHLHELSSRYRIERIPNTLALQVADMDMLGEIRTVHSLSGGESFLVSLSLALGLSSLSSNRMKVESLFIDEGFGALDVETLRTAMDALERLQMQGRKIGVISHVAEMSERIGTQVQVIKTATDRSRIVVVPQTTAAF